MKRSLLIVLVCLIAHLAVGQNLKEEAGISSLYAHEPLKAHLFPNPSVDYVNLKFESPVAREAKIVLHNIIGNSLEFESEVVDSYELRIKVKDFPIGYYFLSAQSADGQAKASFKFLKR